MSYIVNVSVKGVVVSTFGPFADWRDSRNFERDNRDRIKSKWNNTKVTFSEMFTSIDDLEDLD